MEDDEYGYEQYYAEDDSQDDDSNSQYKNIPPGSLFQGAGPMGGAQSFGGAGGGIGQFGQMSQFGGVAGGIPGYG